MASTASKKHQHFLRGVLFLWGGVIFDELIYFFNIIKFFKY